MWQSLTHIRRTLNLGSLSSFASSCSTSQLDVGHVNLILLVVISGKWWRRIIHNAQTQLRSIYISFYIYESVSCMNLGWGEKRFENGFLTILISFQSYFFFSEIISYKFHILSVKGMELFLVSLDSFLLYSIKIPFILFTYFPSLFCNMG